MARRIAKYLIDNSLLLVIGAAAAMLWANVDADGYRAFTHFELWPRAGKMFDLQSIINEVLMAFFFALAGREIWEAMLPGGSLRDLRHAATPLLATAGGMAGPAVFYLLSAWIAGEFSALARGWAIPCATDIAFSYMVAKLIFGKAHPAIPFLLLLAIADDFGGLMILAVFYTSGQVRLMWLLLAACGVAVGFLFKRRGFRSFWWYVIIPGTLSWIGFALAGLRPGLALLAIIPTMPHITAGEAGARWMPAGGTLGRFGRWWRTPVEVILCLFGLVNAGVEWTAIGTATHIVLAALVFGKAAGVWLCGMLGARWLRLGLPEGLDSRGLLVLAFTAGIGFTVALYVTKVAFPEGAIQSAAQMGALGSFAAAVPAILLARLLKTGRWSPVAVVRGDT
jgi:Na+:H+ antiporter, NhaA family